MAGRGRGRPVPAWMGAPEHIGEKRPAAEGGEPPAKRPALMGDAPGSTGPPGGGGGLMGNAPPGQTPFGAPGGMPPGAMHGMPPGMQGGMPPGGMPPGGLATRGMPPGMQGGMPPGGMPRGMPQGMPQGMPPQGMPPQGMPPQGMPPQGMPPQGMPQGMPPQGMPQGMPPQGMPQGMPPQGMPQGMPPQGMPQGMPPQGMPGGYPGPYPGMAPGMAPGMMGAAPPGGQGLMPIPGGMMPGMPGVTPMGMTPSSQSNLQLVQNAPPGMPVAGPNGTVLLSLPNHLAGHIIGKGGATLQGFREQTGVNITIAKEEERIQNQLMRICTITGTPQAAQYAVQMIHQKLAEKNYVPGVSTTSEVIKVPNYLAGRVIGKGGATVQQLKDESGAHIQVSNEDQVDPLTDDRPITLTGTPDTVQYAKELIYRKLNLPMPTEDPYSSSIAALAAAQDPYAAPVVAGDAQGVVYDEAWEKENQVTIDLWLAQGYTLEQVYEYHGIPVPEHVKSK